jgi:hypothetical protein
MRDSASPQSTVKREALANEENVISKRQKNLGRDPGTGAKEQGKSREDCETQERGCGPLGAQKLTPSQAD